MKYFKFNENYELVSATEEEMNYRAEPKIKRPVDAKVVFSGKIFTVYNWEQAQFDGTKSTFETLKRPDSVDVIPITKEGKFVLTKQEQPAAKPFIGAIGGRVDEGETFLHAGIRELHEESGFAANEWINFMDFQGLEKIDWAAKIYFVRGLVIGQSHTDSGEKIELVYYSFGEFMDVVTKENYRDLEITQRIFQIIKAGKLENMKSGLLNDLT